MNWFKEICEDWEPEKKINKTALQAELEMLNWNMRQIIAAMDDYKIIIQDILAGVGEEE